MTSGGPRPGSGRKAGYRKKGAARELLAVRLTAEERRIAEAIGAGNASEGVRAALADWANRTGWHSPAQAAARLAEFVERECAEPTP